MPQKREESGPHTKQPMAKYLVHAGHTERANGQGADGTSTIANGTDHSALLE